MEWAGLPTDPLAAAMWYGSAAGLALFLGYVVRDMWRPASAHAPPTLCLDDNEETSYSEL